MYIVLYVYWCCISYMYRFLNTKYAFFAKKEAVKSYWELWINILKQIINWLLKHFRICKLLISIFLIVCKICNILFNLVRNMNLLILLKIYKFANFLHLYSSKFETEQRCEHFAEYLRYYTNWLNYWFKYFHGKWFRWNEWDMNLTNFSADKWDLWMRDSYLTKYNITETRNTT